MFVMKIKLLMGTLLYFTWVKGYTCSGNLSWIFCFYNFQVTRKSELDNLNIKTHSK